MYAKVFAQIYDSSIAEDYITRLVFMDLLVLADSDGVVDMTHEAIARRTNVPLEQVQKAITQLESPDPKSRTPAESGARIVRIDDHRDWGWFIVNFDRFRKICSEEQRKERTKERVKRYRSKAVTLCNAVKRECNAFPSPSPSTSDSGNGGVGERDFVERPSLKEFLAYCDIHGGPVEWYARDKYLAADADGWKNKKKWQSYADRIREWWINDGRPLTPRKAREARNPKPVSGNF